MYEVVNQTSELAFVASDVCERTIMRRDLDMFGLENDLKLAK